MKTDCCVPKVSCLGFEQEYLYELQYGMKEMLWFVEHRVKLMPPTTEIIRCRETKTWEPKS